MIRATSSLVHGIRPEPSITMQPPAAVKAQEPKIINQAACSCGGNCPRCASSLPVAGDHHPAENEARCQAASLAQGLPIGSASSDLGDSHLPQNTRQHFEQRLSANLGAVQIHTDARATGQLGAAAFTQGNEITFAPGFYKPHTQSGQRLLAHELVHVAQHQRESGGGAPRRIYRASVQYVEAVDAAADADAKKMLASVDAAILKIEAQTKILTGATQTDYTDAVTQLKALGAAGKMKVWRMVTSPPVFAAFHNASGEIRLNYSYPDKAADEYVLAHEAIHALHAKRFPEIASTLARFQGAGAQNVPNIVLLLRKWRCWTEYWAYRRASEYATRPATLAADPDMAHRSAIKNSEVMSARREVTINGDPSFDPSAWNPSPDEVKLAKAYLKSHPAPKP